MSSCMNMEMHFLGPKEDKHDDFSAREDNHDKG